MADCSKQPVQRTRMHVGRNLIVSVVVRIDHCCQTEVAIVAEWVTASYSYTLVRLFQPLNIVKGKKVKERIAVSGIPSHSYGTSLAIWDHIVLPATRHK